MPANASAQSRQGIIVVASLLEKAPNLAGLSRTCEVSLLPCLYRSPLTVHCVAAFTACHIYIPYPHGLGTLVMVFPLLHSDIMEASSVVFTGVQGVSAGDG